MNYYPRIFRFLTLLTIFSLATACQNKPASSLADSSTPGNGSPFEGDFQGDLNNSMAGNGNTGGTVGSGSGGSLTDADKQAISGLTKEMESVNSQEGGLSQGLIDEAKRIMDAEREAAALAETTNAEELARRAEEQARNQAAKMQLVAKILEQCAEKVGPLTPIPGQPLMGTWKGGGACPVEFTVSSTGPQPVYSVKGGTEGRMLAAADGAGDVQAQPFKGSLTDAPKAGTGKLVHPTFHKTKSGTNPCQVAVNLEKSSNPIPENYLEAMKQLGKCHRQALLFMSPVMDKMFSSMPGNLSSILLNRGMGIAR